MTDEKSCPVCGKPFIPNKYRRNQKVCSNLECQYKRQLQNMKKWRDKNPHYFKYKEMRDVKWKEVCRERARKWRQSHLEYLKLYRQEHKEEHKEYMRRYMRDYRRRKKEEAKRKKALEQQPQQGAPTPPKEQFPGTPETQQ